jgi:hypothetical protein
MKRIVVPALILVLAVTSLLTLASWNRSDIPKVRITLSERELPISWSNTSTGDDPGVRLRLAYENRADPVDARNWLTEERLGALGFGMDVTAGSPDAMESYARALPRVGWVALEFNGHAWREIERRRALQTTTEGDPLRHEIGPAPSRLVPVDASSDLDTLVARYPNDHLIVRSIIGLGYLPPGRNGPLVYGWIREIVPDNVTVPRELRSRLNSRQYDVDLAVGRLGIPYVIDIRQRN